MNKIVIVGGQDYMGPTSERDKKVVSETAKILFARYENDIIILTGGMPGIPDDFAKEWKKAGGKFVQCIVSSEKEEEFKAGLDCIGECEGSHCYSGWKVYDT